MTQPDTLHTRLRAEIDRRLAVARAAARTSGSEAWRADRLAVMAGDVLLVQPNAWFGPDRVVAHIALHDPADAVRRYQGELQLLDRHHGYVIPAGQGAYSGRWNCNRCNGMEWPCSEIGSLAQRLGIRPADCPDSSQHYDHATYPPPTDQPPPTPH